MHEAAGDELGDNERLEELKRHHLGETALIEFEVGTDDDDRAARVVDALAEQVLAEAALLALQNVGEGLELALFVARDDFRSVEVLELFEAVVAVDDAAVQVVEVGCGETAAVQRHHRTKVRRDDRQRGHDHPFGRNGVGLEGVQQLDAAHQLVVLGALRLLVDRLGKVLHGLVEVDLSEQFANGLGTDARLEEVAVLERPLLVGVFRDDLERLELLEFLLDDGEVLVQILELLSLAVERVGDLLLAVGVVLGVLGGVLDLLLVLGLDLLLLALILGLHLLRSLELCRLVNGGDDEVGEVDHLFKRLDGEVEHEADLGRHAAQEPDVGHRAGKLDVAHAFTAK